MASPSYNYDYDGNRFDELLFANGEKILLTEISHAIKTIKDIYEYIDVEKSLYRKKTKMSTNPKLVSQKINRYSKLLK